MTLPPYHALLLLLSLPATLATYFRGRTGAEYGVSTWRKWVLLLRMVRNNIRIVSASNFVEHLSMATAILRVPRALSGSIVECGSYKGASTANLSLVAALCGRRLEVFDSFEGLPEPAQTDREHRLLAPGELHTYEKGWWAGSLEEVRTAVGTYGSLESCDFHQGFFECTLPAFDSPCVFVFADVDLRESVATCLQWLWPLMRDGCSFYTHEATHMEIASLFFDQRWWKECLDHEPPGLVGAGSGLGLIPRAGGFSSPLGYAIKAPESLTLRLVPQEA